MSVTPADFLSLSEQLLAQDDVSEIELRASMSRAYYAALHLGRRFHAGLTSPGLEPPPDVGGTHAQLCYRLLNSTTNCPSEKSRCRQIAYSIRTMKLEREKADYDLEPDVREADAQMLVAMAKRVTAVASEQSMAT